MQPLTNTQGHRRCRLLPLLAVLAVAGDAVAQGSTASDRAALEALYDATGGASWTNGTSWKTSAPLGDWYGVTADATGRVTELKLGDNGLTGPIPTELGSLGALQWLDLSSNELSGSIPRAIESLTSLYFLNLSRNALSGSVPQWFGNMSSLLALYLSANELTGGIPDELGNLNLWGLGLSWNDLSVGPIPAWLRNHANLRWLYLSGSDVTGGIPAWLGNRTHLQDLFLDSNELTGSVPGALGDLANLTRLNLAYNWGLSGSLPSGLRQADLERLDILVTRACAPVAWQDRLAAIDFTGRLCGRQRMSRDDVARRYTPAARDAAGGGRRIEGGDRPDGRGRPIRHTSKRVNATTRMLRDRSECRMRRQGTVTWISTASGIRRMVTWTACTPCATGSGPTSSI